MKKNKKKKKHRLFWAFVKLQIFLMILVIAGVAYYYIGGYGKTVKELHDDAVLKVSHSTEADFRNNETSLCYDANGTLISVLKGDKDVYYLEYEEIPNNVFSAFISIEDKKFYSHHGVDVKGIIRAAWAAVRNGEITQGGSTITQQLARNIYLNSDVTWQRKVEEIFIAVELEKVYSKQQILEFYVNNIYFGNGYYGIEAASKGYFNCDVTQLSLSQIAFLCAIPNNPTLYDPLTNMDNTLKRRDRILSNMLEDGKISQSEYSEAVGETITLNQPESVKNDYVETYTYYCAVRALMQNDGFEFQDSFSTEDEKAAYEDEYNSLYSEYQKKLYTEGYRIYTSIDLNMQTQLQDSVDNALASFDETGDDGIYELQSSAVCIDNITGYVKAIVGGRDQNLSGYTLNRAYQSFRQPGSAIKPLIVYTPALERGYTPDTIVTDAPIEDGPENADGTYDGDITLRTAVEKSKNTIAWNLFNEVTPEVGLSYLLEMNFSHIDSDDYRLPSALGGFTDGVSSLEMTAGYAAIENDGKYREPTCIMKITDADGNIILESTQEEHQIYKVNASRMMTDMLQSVLTEGTGHGLGISQMESAGKTGTTNDNKDGWFVGYSYYYTTGVWVGYDSPKELTGLSGATYPGKIWSDFMETIHDGLTPINFPDYVTYDGTVDEEEEQEIETGMNGQEDDASQDSTVTQDSTATQNTTDTDTQNTGQTDSTQE